MENDRLILGEGQYYSMDCYTTKLNNNVLVVGASGSGKTRSIVTPNLLQAYGSYIVSDPKGNLYSKYKNYLESKGYAVQKLDFTDPDNSEGYNFFDYIQNTQDIIKISHMMMQSREGERHLDPFWDEAAQLLIQSLIAFLIENGREEDRNLGGIQRLLTLCQVNEYNPDTKSPLDKLMEHIQADDPGSFAAKSYVKFRIAAGKTLKSILITVNSRIGLFDTPEINRMTGLDTINIPAIGRRKTALFVVVSDTDRSMDTLANLFFTQAMNELCLYADKNCPDNRLPIPVRFIMDDFATNCKIAEFPRMISSIRSRGISAMLMLQAESQLESSYGRDWSTIIANCDTYVYTGGNDVETAKAVATRCDMPVQEVLNMPVGNIWIFRRGQEPINGRLFDIEPFLDEKLAEGYEQAM